MKFHLRMLRPIDVVVIAFALAVTVGSAILAFGESGAATQVRVETENGSYLYDLSQNATMEFSGPLGITVVEIRDGRARVVSSPCREQICVNAGFLSSGGDWTACLPNRIFLEVTGEKHNDIDAVSF